MSTENNKEELFSSKIRSYVLRGDIMLSSEQITKNCSSRDLLRLWRVPRKKLLVFVSSTFTDTHKERNILQEKILPKLRVKGRDKGIEVTFVDMRWGVRDENTLNHMTWISCHKELERCREESAGMFFLSFQSDKYGYMPLPRAVRKDLFEERIKDLNVDIQALSNSWYILDTNGIPQCYVLKNLISLQDSDYWNALPILRKALQSIPFHEGLEELFIDRSVTEWEVKAALSKQSSIKNCYWIHRNFKGGVSKLQDERQLLYDAHDSSTELKLKNLKMWMESAFINPITFYKDLSVDSYIQMNNDWSTYIDIWERETEDLFMKELETISLQRIKWLENSNGLLLPGETTEELLQHYQWGFEKCIDFYGRENDISTILSLILKEKKTLKIDDINSSTAESKLNCVDLVIVGKSGVGKTSIMAKLVEQIYGLDNIKRPIIVRFCGISDGSKDGLSLMKSICHQINFIYNKNFNPLSDESFSEYNQVKSYFHSLLRDFPVLLFVDSLDQLSNKHLARSKISFLNGLKAHPDTRIILSTLPDEKYSNSNRWVYYYGAETTLKAARLPMVYLKHFEEPEKVLEFLLKQKSRSLTIEQNNVIIKSYRSEPTALYLRLASSIAENWSSFTTEFSIQSNVKDVINQIFDSFEIQFGKLLIHVSLGLITFSLTGINDSEMEDILSTDDMVLDSVFQYSTPGIRRLPPHVWLRIKGELKGLLVENEGGCNVWYHRQILETMRTRYNAEEKRALYHLMANYYGNRIDSVVKSDRYIASQPLVFENVSIWDCKIDKINKRRCIEGTHHLLHYYLLDNNTLDGLTEEQASNDEKNLLTELCNIELICAFIKLGEGFQLIEHFSNLKKLFKKDLTTMIKDAIMQLLNNTPKASSSSPNVKTADHYLRWLKQDMTTMVLNPKDVIFNSCLNNQPFESIARKDMIEYLERTRIKKVSESFSNDSTIRKLKMGGISNFSSLTAVLHGHTDEVLAVALSYDSKFLISASSDKTILIWDVYSGFILNVLEGHSDKVNSVTVDLRCLYIASGSADKSVRVWELATGAEVFILKGHNDIVTSLKWSPDSTKLISGSKDHTIRIWNTSSGEEMAVLNDCQGEVTCIDVNSQGSLFAAGSIDQVVYIWNLDNLLKPELCLRDHSHAVTCLAFNPTNETIVTGSNCSLNIWNLSDGGKCFSLAGHTLSLISVSWSLNGDFLASSSNDLTVRVWDISKQSCVAIVSDDHHDRYLSNSLSWIPRLSNETVSNLQKDKKEEYEKSKKEFNSVLAIGSNDYLVRLYDFSYGFNNVSKSHHDSIHSILWGNEPNEIYSITDDSTLYVWNSKTGELNNQMNIVNNLSTTDYARLILRVLSISTDKSKILCLAVNNDILLVDFNSKLLLQKCKYEMKYCDLLTVISWSKDFNIIAATDQSKSIQIWNLHDRENNFVFIYDNVISSIACSQDSSYLAISFDTGKLIVISIERLFKSYTTDGTLKSIPEEFLVININAHIDSIVCMSFSNDRKYLMTGSIDATAKVWNLSKASELSVLIGHKGPITAVAWSHDNSRIITGSIDCDIIVWDSNNGKKLSSVHEHSNEITSLAWHPSDALFISGSKDKKLVLCDSMVNNSDQETSSAGGIDLGGLTKALGDQCLIT